VAAFDAGNRKEWFMKEIELTQWKAALVDDEDTEKSSKFPGVCWHKCTRKWMACIQINGGMKYLGYYHVEEDAFEAYRVAVNALGDELHEKYLEQE
jgi:hypothetical protein